MIASRTGIAVYLFKAMIAEAMFAMAQFLFCIKMFMGMDTNLSFIMSCLLLAFVTYLMTIAITEHLVRRGASASCAPPAQPLPDTGEAKGTLE